MHLRDGVLDRHRDVLLRDLWCCAGAAVTPVEVDDVRTRVIAADGHHLDIVRRRDLDRQQRLGIDGQRPVKMLLVVLDRVDAVERERREQARVWHGLPHPGDIRRVLVAQEVAAEPGLRALGVLELDYARPADRLLPHAEQARRYLGDHVVLVRHELLGVASLTGGYERVPLPRRDDACEHRVDADRPERHAPAVEGHGHGYPSSGAPPVELHRGGYLLWVVPGPPVGQHEPQLVEAAAGDATVRRVVQRYRLGGLRLPPGGEYHLLRPPRIPEAQVVGAIAHRERFGRTVPDAEVVVRLARWADASPVVGRQYPRMPLYASVDAVRAQALAQST